MRLRRRSTARIEDIDAIPVCYRGTRMRSTLEGRWAVFLDQLGIAWQYEPGAVNVGGRNRYVDFWLPGLASFLEVKPAHTPLDEAFALSLSEQRGSPLIWLSGNPWPGEYEATFYGLANEPPLTHLRWAVGRLDHSEIWVINVGLVWALRLGISPLPLDWETATGNPQFPLFDCELLRSAYREASRYRFETAEDVRPANREDWPGRRPPRSQGETNPDR